MNRTTSRQGRRTAGPRRRTALALLLALGVGAGSAAVAPDVAVAAPSRTLMVLGDSYSSGEGLAPYLAGTDEPWGNRCHRSDKAYGARAAAKLGFDVVNRACSGATIDDMWRDSAANPGEIAQTKGLHVLGPEDAVAMTIGGNDAEWVALLHTCVTVMTRAPGLSECLRRKNEGEATIRRTVARLEPLYRAVVGSTDARVNVLLYPSMMPVRSRDATADCTVQRLTPLADVSVSADTSRHVVEMQVLFNDLVREAVARIGNPRLQVVDTVKAFGGYEGHTITCGFGNRPAPWINAARLDAWHFTPLGQVTDPLAGLERASRGQLHGDGAFHPTEDGHQAMADALSSTVSG